MPKTGNGSTDWTSRVGLPHRADVFSAVLPFTLDAWKRVEAILGNAEGEYWSTTVANPYDPLCDIYFAVEKLLVNGRPRSLSDDSFLETKTTTQ